MICREKEKFRTKHKIIQNKLISNNGGLKCICVDGKRNKNTMVQETRVVNGQEQVKQMRKTREHQVYTVEPSGQYLCHSEIQEEKGTGRGLSEDFYEMLIEHDSVETLDALPIQQYRWRSHSV